MNKNKLKKYLADNNLTQAAFAQKHGILRVEVNRSLSGVRKPSPRIALIIEKATKGAVPFRGWFDDSVHKEQLQESA